MANTIIIVLQIFFSAIVAIYFLSQLLSQQSTKSAISSDSRKELEKIKKLEEKKLTVPLCEKTRPSSINEIIGQEDGLKALTAAICGPNPQHVIIYGPPGVGKTAAARIMRLAAEKL